MSTDARTTVARLVDARDWRPFHSPKNLSTSIAMEAAELMERSQWLTTEEAQAAQRTHLNGLQWLMSWRTLSFIAQV